MLHGDGWLRVIYEAPGLQDASPRYIIFYPSVMQIINSYYFMVNYFPDLHFNDSRPSIHAYTLCAHSHAAHSHSCADDSFVRDYIRSFCQKRKKEKRGERSEGKQFSLVFVSWKRFIGKIRTWLVISKSSVIASKSVTKRWKGYDGKWEETEGEGGLKEGSQTSNLIRCGLMFLLLSLYFEGYISSGY